MASGIVALGDEDVVLGTVLQRLVDGDRWAEELLFDFTQTLETWLKFNVVVRIGFSDSRDNGDVVALGADVVCRRDDSDVDV